MGIEDATSIADLRERARRRLPRVIFDYLDGGAEDEVTLAENRAAFRRYVFVPRVLRGSASCDLSVTLFGDAVRVPWVVGPTGLNGLMWHEADLALARDAERAGAIFTLSTASNVALEALAAIGGVKWFQLYPLGDRRVWHRLVERASEAGFRALIVTIDSLLPGNRERDKRHRFAHQITFTPRVVLDGLAHPGWLAGVWLRGGAGGLGNLQEIVGASASSADLADYMRKMKRPDLSWDDLAWIRRQWNGAFVVKGLLAPDDAVRALRIGADGIVVSNHGGRQLDGAIATLDALPPIVDVVGDKMTVMIDGGFRRGSDIAKALALGAKAILLGRATLYGVAAAGERGAARALSIVREETERVLALVGCTNARTLSATSLRSASAVTSRILAVTPVEAP